MFLGSFQSYNSFPLDSVKPTEVLSVIGVKGAKRKKKTYILVSKKWHDGIAIVNNSLRF